MKSLMLMLTMLFSLSAFSKELHDVKMADDLKIAGQSLKLKGMGIREINILGIYIRVYVAGLYVADPTLSCDKIIKSDKVRAIYMSFLRHASPEDLNKNLQKGVSGNCEDKCNDLIPQAKNLKKFIPSVNTGDILKITFDSKGTEFALNDKVLGREEGVPFSQTLLAAYIGKEPATEDLKAGLCGTK